MSSDRYEDTEERKELLIKLAELRAPVDPVKVYTLIEEYYPGWFVDRLTTYSLDYPHLQKNWETICGELKTNPKEILLVDNITFLPEYKIQGTVCELLCKNGYIVRRKGEFFPCTICGRALPCLEIWNNFKKRKIPCPSEWNVVCVDCECKL